MNKILFSSRLADLRKKRGFKTQYALAKAYNEKFPTKRRNDASGNEGDFGGIFGTIKNYENPNRENGQKLSVVCNLCELLDCDIDYLIGKIEVPQHETADIMALTGLSEKAVETILLLRRDNQMDWGLDALNFLLETTDFLALLYYMIQFSTTDEGYIEYGREHVKKRDVFEMRLIDYIKKIANNLAEINKNKPDDRHLYKVYISAYMEKSNSGIKYSLAGFQKAMEADGLFFDPKSFEGREQNG